MSLRTGSGEILGEAGHRSAMISLKTISKSVALLLLGLVMAGILSEVTARILFPHWAPRTGALTSFWRHDPTLGWSHVPNSKGSFSSFGFESMVTINSKGFRDKERSYERDPAKYRIVVLGDSMVWGWGVQQNEIFTALLEKQRQDIEVINLGVSGYGTDQELILLRQEAVRYNPDLIVVVVMDNDFDTNVRKALFLGYNKPAFELANDGNLHLINTPVPEQSLWVHIAVWPVRHSYVLNQAARAYEQFTLMLASRKSPPQRQQPQTIDADDHVSFPQSFKESLTTALLFAIQKESQKNGAELLLILTDRLGKHGERIERYFKSQHVRILNLDPFFPRNQVEELHVPDRVHWTARGHQKVADGLLDYLKNEHLLKEPLKTAD
ncbi:MAG: SGNH/GDSL hydrolase family protein [Nitrospiraceae bacterium]